MIVHRKLALLSLIALATNACSMARIASGDRICPELFAFVGGSATDGTSSVVLKGGWGGDTKGVVMTHDCRASGGAAAQRFCDYLVPNTSWEFGENNLKRLATCFADKVAAESLGNAAASTETVVIPATLAVGAAGSTGLAITYKPTSMSQSLYTLTVTVPHIEQ